MRLISFLSLVLTLSSLCAAEDFSVFKKDGRFGVKDENGAVTVPAVYDQLGWSDGGSEVFDEVIGFRRNGLWGLVSVKNKILTESKFYTINPLSKKHIKASVKGRFSNQLFYGLLNVKGEILVSFNYADLASHGEHLIATSFDQFKSKVGIITLTNEVMIPLAYERIISEGEFILAERSNQQKDVFYDFKIVAQNLDSVQLTNGLIGFRSGRAGFLSSTGQLMHDFEYKSISIDGGKSLPIPFPRWEVKASSEKIFEANCDSLSFIENKWVLYLNGAQHFKFPKHELNSSEHILQEIAGENLIVRHSKTNQWSVWNEAGKTIIEGQDYILASGEFFLTRKEEKSHIFNSFGSKITSLPFEEIGPAGENFFIAKRDEYWGVIDFRGDAYITFKYDSIISTTSDYYGVKFLGKWGITDKHGNWKVNPEYQQIEIFGDLMVARKQSSYSYFNRGEFLFRSTFVIKSFLDDFLLIEDETGKKGLLNLQGRLQEYPAYDRIRKFGNYFVFQKGDTSAAIYSTSGEVLIDFEEGYKDFGGLLAQHISARKNGRWGFIDIEGRLRISNRYEEVKPFQDDLAAVKLRGKWGFIDMTEKIVIQPHYDYVSSFIDNIAIAEADGLFGLINKEGQEVVGMKWTSITRTKNGNYLISAENGPNGLVNAKGAFILRPNYDHIEDIDFGIIVGKDGKYGVLNYDGSQVYNLIYSSIRQKGEFLLLAK